MNSESPAIPSILSGYVSSPGQGRIIIAPRRQSDPLRMVFPAVVLLLAIALGLTFIFGGAGVESAAIALFGALGLLIPLLAILTQGKIRSEILAVDLSSKVATVVANRSSDVYSLSNLRLVDNELRTEGTPVFSLLNVSTGEVVCSLRLSGRQRESADALEAFLRNLFTPATSEQATLARPRAQRAVIAKSAFATLGLFFAIIAISVGFTGAFIAVTGTGVAGFLFCIFFLFLALILSNLRVALQSRSWPSVMGRIEEEGVSVSRSSTTGSEYSPHIMYSYAVDGVSYIGRFISARTTGLTGRSAYRLIAQWTPGQQVPVYYNPNRPADSLLQTGADRTTWFSLSLFLVLTLAAGIWMSRSWHGVDFHRLPAFAASVIPELPSIMVSIHEFSSTDPIIRDTVFVNSLRALKSHIRDTVIDFANMSDIDRKYSKVLVGVQFGLPRDGGTVMPDSIWTTPDDQDLQGAVRGTFVGFNFAAPSRRRSARMMWDFSIPVGTPKRR